MIDISKVINTASLICGKFIDNDISKLNQQVYEFSRLPDEELQTKCHNKEVHSKDKAIWSYLFEKIPFIQKKTNDAIIEKLALGVAAFNKYPADLPENSVLYPTQIKAALSLTQSCVLQMNTGEGKTYALLPAVFALSCKYNKVYIVCANEYLAQRDAIRTKNYWDFVGLDVQFCSKEDSNNFKWKSDVIYTTLTALMFKGMNDDLHKVSYKCRLSFDACIIDEIDAVLFDNDTTHCVVQQIDSNIYDWHTAIDYAKTLTENTDITVDREDLTASLTIIGEENLKNHIHNNSIPLSKYGQLRKAIETSFIALSLRQDRDYILHENTIYSINRHNGEIEYNITQDWIIPLEIMQGLQPRPHRIALHEVNPRVFLRQFNHISGMSATVIEDSAEYFYAYSLPVVVIEPRIKRKNGELLDEIYKSHKVGVDAITEKIIQIIEHERPVLVGTQNIKDASLIYNSLCSKLADRQDVNVNLITGKNEKNIAKIYQKGGNVGSVIIATQLAGRGVDIRLSEEARNNGGLAILGFERAVDRRLDKQFFGRAGRQGDPYTAQFIVTLEGNLMQMFATQRIQLMMNEGIVIENQMISNAIIRAQNKVRANEFHKRRAKDFRISTEDSIYHNIKNWLNNLNVDYGNTADCLSESFILFVIDHFIESNLSNIIQNNLNSEQARNIIDIISLQLHIKQTDLVNSADLEGKEQSIVYKQIRNSILNCINNTITNNTKISKSRNVYFRNKYRYNFFQCMIAGEPNSHNRWIDTFLTLKKCTDKYKHRTPYLIAYWTIVNAEISYRNFETKFNHNIWKDDINILQHYRLLSDGLVSEWDKIESGLSSSILRNILTEPDLLDNLFFYEDNQISDYKRISEESELVKEWDNIKNGSTPPQIKSEVNDIGKKLISDFISQSDIGLGINFDVSSLKYLLEFFLDDNPINTLQFPDKIILALEQWKSKEIRTGVSDERKEINHKWIRLFLNFLNKKSIIVMPSFKHKINAVAQKIIKNVKDYKIVVPMTQMLLWGILFVLLSVYGNWFRPLNYNIFGITLLDNFLCAGWLRKGIITAPVFLIYLLSNYPLKENIVVKYMFSLGCPISLVWLSTQAFSFSNILLATVSCILYTKSVDVIHNTEKSLNLSLMSMWLIFCISSSLIPILMSVNIIPLVIFATISLYYCFIHRRINKEQILLMSSQITGSYTNLETDIFKNTVSIDGNTKSIPHIYAFIFSYLASFFVKYIPFPYDEYNMYIVILSYLIILLLSTREQIRKILSIPLWQQRLNSNRQIIIDKNIQDNIMELETDKILTTIKRKLLKKEIVLQVIVLLFCVVVLKDYQFGNFQYPMSLVVLFSAVLFGEHTVKFIEQISHLLIFSGRISNETLDFREIKEPEEDKTLIQKIKDYFNPFKKTRRFLNTLFSVIFVIYVLVEIYKLLFQ